jgi:hypothetical protein
MMWRSAAPRNNTDRRIFSKVPEVTPGFWIINKIANDKSVDDQGNPRGVSLRRRRSHRSLAELEDVAPSSGEPNHTLVCGDPQPTSERKCPFSDCGLGLMAPRPSPPKPPHPSRGAIRLLLRELRDAERLNETSDCEHGPADRSDSHRGSAQHRGSMCRYRVHVHLRDSTIFVIAPF